MGKVKKGEFGSPWNESLGFKCGTPIMLGPISYVILCPLVYKLAVAKCTMLLFTSFQIFQKPLSTWAPMSIQLQTTSVQNPSKR